MKKKVLKTMVAAVCVVAAGVSGMKAYNNQSEVNMLLEENVEALSKNAVIVGPIIPCPGKVNARCKAAGVYHIGFRNEF